MGVTPDFVNKRKTCKRYNFVGDAHALTFSCFQRRAFHARDRTRRWFLESLNEARRALNFEVWAYVVMPEHVHVLIYPSEKDYSISDILLATKRPVARKAVCFVRESAPGYLEQMRDSQPNGKFQYRFWQRGGGYDRNLVHPEIIHKTIEYIHANPVRRALVKSPTDWSWSSAKWYKGLKDVPFVPDTLHLPARKA